MAMVDNNQRGDYEVAKAPTASSVPPAYSWERLAPQRRREVLNMVRSAHGRRRGQLIVLLVVLLVVLGALGTLYFFNII